MISLLAKARAFGRATVIAIPFAFALGAATLLAVCTGCQHSLKSADEGAQEDPIHDTTGPAPEISIAVRANLIAGRPVPYRLTMKNSTKDVLVPIVADASVGQGGSTWARPLVGDVTYDSETDHYVENPLAQPVARQLLYRSVLEPGESLVEEFDVRYPRSGSVDEKVRVLFHRLSRSEFESRVYVGTGGAIPRRFGPVGLLGDASAKKGALLAGFYLRLDRKPEAVSGTVTVELPAVPPAVAARIRTAGLDPDGALAASWLGGWVAGDKDRSVVVTGDATKALPGVPLDVLRRIDAIPGNVPFCISGATKEEIAPFFAGYEIVPLTCLHVSVPREAILRTLEKIGAAGYTVRPFDLDLHDAFDLAKRAP